MAIGSSAVCDSFKQEVLTAVHNFSASGGDQFKIALYTNSASISSTTTAYTSSGETTNTTGSAYSAGGSNLTHVEPALKSTSTACCDFSDVSWTTASFTAYGALIYNSTDSNKAVCVLDFGGDKTSTSGTFTIQFPAADSSNAILRLA